MLKRLWVDEGGAILSAELILIMTILVIGLIVGLKTLQTAIVTELGDVANAIGALNQSYVFTGFTENTGILPGNCPVLAQTAGSTFSDAPDADDSGSIQMGGIVQGITCNAPSAEGGI